MMNNLWAKAIAIIDSKVLTHLKQRPSLRRWLEQLRNDYDGERLVICLAIDLAYDAYRVDKLNHIRALLGFINVKTADARSEFAFHLEQLNQTGHLNCASRFSADSRQPLPSYATVMRIQKFIASIGSTNLFADNAPGRDRLLRRIKRNPKFRLSKPESWWTHPSGIVWLAPTDELRMLLSKNSAMQATAAKHALGISHPNLKPETPVDYVLVEYPAAFLEPCYQPTTFDAWWKDKGHYYLSWHKDDNWGRTQNCVGSVHETKNLRVRERVHQCYQGPTDEFIVTYLGTYPGDAAFSSQLEQGRLALREEAYNRLRNAPAPKTAKANL